MKPVDVIWVGGCLALLLVGQIFTAKAVQLGRAEREMMRAQVEILAEDVAYGFARVEERLAGVGEVDPDPVVVCPDLSSVVEGALDQEAHDELALSLLAFLLGGGVVALWGWLSRRRRWITL